MAKVYDALRNAEARRQQRTGSPASTAALLARQAQAKRSAQVGGTGELDSLRDILLGAVIERFALAVERIEERIEADAVGFRAELGKLEQRVEARLAEVDSRSCKGQGELREQLLAQSSRLGDMIKERSAEAVRLVNDGLQDLGQAKLDGSDFSSFVKKLASHIDGENASACGSD